MGKTQFKVVAEASKEFDKYMKQTLGAIEEDLAYREDIRYDRYGDNMANEPQQARLRPERSMETKFGQSRRNAKDSDSEDEESSSTGNDDDDDDENEEKEDELTNKRHGKSRALGPSKSGNSKKATVPDEDEYEQFRRFQEMMKKHKGKE